MLQRSLQKSKIFITGQTGSQSRNFVESLLNRMKVDPKLFFEDLSFSFEDRKYFTILVLGLM
jgi:hypothetical protein